MDNLTEKKKNYICVCGKEYMYKTSLSRHSKICDGSGIDKKMGRPSNSDTLFETQNKRIEDLEQKVAKLENIIEDNLERIKLKKPQTMM